MAFGKEILSKLCRLNIDGAKCKWATPTLQQLIGCKPGKTLIGTDNILLEFNLTVPVNYDKEYTIYKPFNVPIFEDQKIKQIDGFKDKYILKIGNSTDVKLLNECDNIHGTLRCSAETEIDLSVIGCMRGMFLSKAETCKFRESRQMQSCFVKRSNNGILISTINDLDIHKQDKDSVFATKEQVAKGVSFIRNEMTSTRSVNCGGLVITTELTEQFELELQVNKGLNWTELIRKSETHIGQLESSFTKQQNILHGNIKQINETMGELTNRLNEKKIDVRELVPENAKQRTLLLTVSIIAAILLIILLGIAIMFYCKKKNNVMTERERIQEVTRRQRRPDYISEPIVQDNRTPLITFPISRPSILNSPYSAYHS